MPFSSSSGVISGDFGREVSMIGFRCCEGEEQGEWEKSKRAKTNASKFEEDDILKMSPFRTDSNRCRQSCINVDWCWLRLVLIERKEVQDRERSK